MKRIFSGMIMLACTSITLLISGCQKNADVETPNPIAVENAITVEEASAWFAADLVSKEKELLAQPYSILPQKSPQRSFARMGKLQKKLIWNEARVYNRNGLQYIVVPIPTNTKLRSSEYEIERAFIFYKNKGREMNMNVVEVMSEKGKNLNGKSDEVIAAAFNNHMTGKNETIAGVNATVFFYNDAYQSLTTYKVNNGMWASINRRMQITNAEGAGLKNTQGIGTESDGCNWWYVVQFNYEDGVMVSWEILYSYQECPQGGGGSNTDPQTEDPNGGGGGANQGGEEDYDLDSEVALLSEVVSTNTYNQQQIVTYTTPTLTEVPFQWVVVKNALNLWTVTSSDISEGYNSTNTGGIIYRLQHLGSSISGQTSWNRIPRRTGLPVLQLINLTWDETSYLTTISPSYRTGSVIVSGDLKNFGLTLFSKTNSITVSAD